MALDEAARERLMREYAPRLLAAGVTPPDEEVDEQEEPGESDTEEQVEELLEMVPDVVVVENPDGETEDDPEPDDDDDDTLTDEPGPMMKPGSMMKPAKSQERAYTIPRQPHVQISIGGAGGGGGGNFGSGGTVTYTSAGTGGGWGYAPATTSTPQNGMSWTSNEVTWNPIVTTVGARTFLTAPATTERASMWGAVPNPNPHILWMQGRFVGGDRPNRNNAFWSSSDLELGRPTVAHGPLNWLHEEKHVIGTIADARFIRPGGPQEQAAETQDPHIAALSAIWRWVYPQEAGVVQMASDAGVLAYSMECISEAVQCVGDNGCGQTVPYMAYAQGQTCDHLKERATVRRLVNPTFLGGAVIVPPTRPGWADADAKVMAEAAKVAEKAYEDAGRPDIPASTWEQLMAGVTAFTQSP